MKISLLLCLGRILMQRLLTLMALLLILSACQVFGGGGDSAPTGGGENPVSENPIQWDRNPNTIVFRSEVVGGEYEGTFFARNEVPYCTIYGDNRIVWTVETGFSDAQVLIDRLTDEQVQAFVGALAVELRFYTFDAQADFQPPTNPSPVVEVMTLNVNGIEHKTDAFGEWPPDFFQDVLLLCQSLSQAPVEYLPDGAWISAQVVDFSAYAPMISWDGEAAGLVLKELAESGERRWVEGRITQILWRLLRRTGLDSQFAEGDAQYQVAVEVPGINKNAPPK
jgi:hypothetical protein